MRSRALNLAALALLVGLCGLTSLEVRPAAAQALDAGKPPAQIFSGTCSACHRSPRGLVRNVSPGSLPGFLRQHYTTGNDMAGTMAAYVLGNGGTDRVAEPAPKREPKQEPKQRAKSDAPDVAARTVEPKELPKSARQQKGKKGQEPAAKDAPATAEPEKADAAKSDQAATEPAKADAAAVECKVEEPAKQAAAPVADDGKAAFAVPTPASTPPRQPTSLLTLPGFPAPVPEPEPEPVATAAAQPGCEPVSSTSATTARGGDATKEAATDTAKDAPKEQSPTPAPPAPAALAEAPKSEPLRPAVAETATPALDIMLEEVHASRPVRPAQQQQKKKQ